MRGPGGCEPTPKNVPETGRSVAMRRSLVPIFVFLALLVTVGVIVGFTLSMKDATVRKDLRTRKQSATTADLDRLRSKDADEKLAAIQEFAERKSIHAIRPLLEATVTDNPPADTKAQEAIRGMGALALKPLLDVILDLDSFEQGTEEWELLDYMRVNAGKTFELIADDLPEETVTFLLRLYEFDEDFEGDEKFYFDQVLGLVLRRAKLSSTDPLVSIFRSKDVSVRRTLLSLLGEIADGSNNALPLLVVCLRDEDEQMRTLAASYIGEIGAESDAALQALVRLFGDPSAEVRATAITAIESLDERGQDFVPELVRALDDKDASVVQAAATALARFEPERLVDALKHETVDVRYTALITLSELKYKDAVDEMLGIARADDHAELRPIALQAIGQIGSGAHAAIPALIKIFERTDEGSLLMRLEACVALGQIAREKDTVIPVLRRALSDENAEVRQTAVLALGNFGTDAEAALDDYFRLIGDPDVADAAKDALVPFGKRVVERFEKLLLNESVDVRVIAVTALYEIGDDAATAVPTIAKCLTDEEDEVSRLAAEALGALAGQGGRASAQEGCRRAGRVTRKQELGNSLPERDEPDVHRPGGGRRGDARPQVAPRAEGPRRRAATRHPRRGGNDRKAGSPGAHPGARRRHSTDPARCDPQDHEVGKQR
jgi:HEAT repeat protein